MAERYVDRCSVNGCPEPNSEEFHTPWCQEIKGHKCFGGATHQHIPKKGMGGNNPESEIVACICQGAHDKIDNSPYWGNAVLDVPGVGKVYRIWRVKDNSTLLERTIEAAPGPDVPDEEHPTTTYGPPNAALDDDERPTTITLPAVKEEIPVLGRVAPPPILELDLSVASDEDLARLFAEADRKQADFFLAKCKIIHAYRERHVRHWGGTWLEHAYALFEGAPSRRTLEAYANIWTCVASDEHLLEHIGPLTDSRSLMQFIGRKKPEDGRKALETAVAHLAEFGEAPTVPALQHKLGEEAKPDLCPKTGLPHDWERKCRNCGKERA